MEERNCLSPVVYVKAILAKILITIQLDAKLVWKGFASFAFDQFASIGISNFFFLFNLLSM